MPDVRIEDVYVGSLTALARPALVRLGERTNCLEASIRTDRFSRLADQLEAVVVGRIVARRHHNAAVGREVHDRKIHHLGPAETDVEHLDTGVGEASGNSVRKLSAR